MSNTNHLDGRACPECGYEARFIITISGTAIVTDDGIDDVIAADWDDSSPAVCPACDHAGEWGTFVRPAPGWPVQSSGGRR